MNILIWILVTLVSLFFIVTGSIKVLGQPKKLFNYQFEAYFKKFGIGRMQVRFIGLAELFGAITMWLHQSNIVGKAGLAVLVLVTLGAIISHLRFGVFKDAIPAIVMFVLSSVLLITSLLT